MDKPHGATPPSPGYETRDANARGVFIFMIVLSIVLIITALVCWGLFRYLSAKQVNPGPASPFAGTRQLPAGPQLQVNPRQDLLKFKAQQEHSLESYSWENKEDGTVRVPIERAMELLLQKGLPVAPEPSRTVAEPVRRRKGARTVELKIHRGVSIAAIGAARLRFARSSRDLRRSCAK